LAVQPTTNDPVVTPALQVTVLVPMGNTEPEAGVQVTATGAPALSAVGLKVTATPAALVADAEMFAKGGLNTGGLGSQVAATFRDRSREQTALPKASSILTNGGGPAKAGGRIE
jgi:hypothetical protein